MQRQFGLWLRAGYGLLIVLACWAIWSSANGADTNSAGTNALPVGPRMVKVPAELVENPLAALERAATSETVMTFGLDRVPFLQQHQIFGAPLWKYLASLIYVLLAFYSSKLIDWVVSNQLKVWASRTKTELDDLLLNLLHGPIKVVSLVIFLHIGFRLFVWPPWVEDYTSKGLRLVVAWSLTFMALKAVDLTMSYWRRNLGRDEDRAFNDQFFPIITKTFKAFVVVVAVLLTTQNLGMNITSALASLSIGGLALGLAAQDTIANLFGAVAIFIDRPFRIGDRIKLESVDGVVESIGLRSTRVRNLDGHLITVPNKTMGGATITNISRRPGIKTEMNIGVTYDTSPQKVQRAIKILQDTYKAHPKTKDILVSFNKFGDSALNLMVVHWWNGADYPEYLAGMQEMNLAIMERFGAEGIEFAFPSQTLYLKQDAAAKVVEAAAAEPAPKTP